MMRDGWADAPDAAHPIRWQDAGGTDTAYLTEAEAQRRLAGYYTDGALALADIRAGATLRTPFAFYSLAVGLGRAE